jgi:hypothetical protein
MRLDGKGRTAYDIMSSERRTRDVDGNGDTRRPRLLYNPETVRVEWMHTTRHDRVSALQALVKPFGYAWCLIEHPYCIVEGLKNLNPELIFPSLWVNKPSLAHQVARSIGLSPTCATLDSSPASHERVHVFNLVRDADPYMIPKTVVVLTWHEESNAAVLGVLVKKGVLRTHDKANPPTLVRSHLYKLVCPGAIHHDVVPDPEWHCWAQKHEIHGDAAHVARNRSGPAIQQYGSRVRGGHLRSEINAPKRAARQYRPARELTQ